MKKEMSDNLYELFLQNLYESGFLNKTKRNQGLLLAALQEHRGLVRDETPKMLRMRYLVDDYEEFEEYYQKNV